MDRKKFFSAPRAELARKLKGRPCDVVEALCYIVERLLALLFGIGIVLSAFPDVVLVVLTVAATLGTLYIILLVLLLFL